MKVPKADLTRGMFSDHFSHMNAARFFMHVGWGKWKHSMSESLRRLTPEERAALPEDERAILGGGDEAYEVPGFPKDKPIIASWSGLPHFYPPGDLVLVAPIAAAYHFTAMRLGTACRLLILLFLAFAHAGVFLLLERFFDPEAMVAPVGFLGLFIGYSELVHWSLEGFYDAALAVPLILCSRYLRANRPLAAGVAYCAAAFIHYRAFFFAPLTVYAAYLLLRQRAWKQFGARQWAAVGVAAALGGISLATFFTVLPITAQAPNNPIYSFAAGGPTVQASVFLLVCALIATACVRARAWMDLALLAWLALMLLRMPTTYEWYLLVPLAWVGFETWGRREAVGDVRDGRVLFMVVAGAFASRYAPLPQWLHVLFDYWKIRKAGCERIKALLINAPSQRRHTNAARIPEDVL